jgi:hypothetical protein
VHLPRVRCEQQLKMHTPILNRTIVLVVTDAYEINAPDSIGDGAESSTSLAARPPLSGATALYSGGLDRARKHDGGAGIRSAPLMLL